MPDLSPSSPESLVAQATHRSPGVREAMRLYEMAARRTSYIPIPAQPMSQGATSANAHTR